MKITEKDIQYEMKIDKLQAVIREYNKAADKFIQKCRDGRAKSVETQRDLAMCRQYAKEVMGE